MKSNSNKDGQYITHLVYEDPEVVENYIQRNAIVLKQADTIKSFSKTINGKRVLDLGCGPGQESYLFSELGFNVTGLDFSKEMIKRAKKLKQSSNQPNFIVGDMMKLTEYFEDNTFDAVWANASILHIRKNDLQEVLKGITSVSKDGAKIFIRLKSGENITLFVKEKKYTKETVREFTIWTKEGFLKQIKKVNWKLDNFFENEGSHFRGKITQWLNFEFTVRK